MTTNATSAAGPLIDEQDGEAPAKGICSGWSIKEPKLNGSSARQRQKALDSAGEKGNFEAETSAEG